MQIEFSSYRDLKVWQLAMSIAELVYRVTATFPRTETYGMTSQIRRAAVSIAANIAEGHGRENTCLFVHSLRYAQGSLKELETHLLLAGRVGLAHLNEIQPVLERCDELGRMLRALICSLQRGKEEQ